MYKLTEISNLDDDTTDYIFQFSQWMKGSGVSPDEVFLVSSKAITQKNDKLSIYIISLDNSIVGYLAFFLGINSIRFSRINFFTISPSYRGKGKGKEILLSCLKFLMMDNDITSVACDKSLVKFYKSCGFESVGQADNGDEVLLFSLSPINEPISSIVKEEIALVGYDGSFKEKYSELEEAIFATGYSCD